MARLPSMSGHNIVHAPRDRRERVYHVCARDVLDFFGRKPHGDRFDWPLIDLPEGCEVLAVREVFDRKTFAFLVWHPSFDIVPDRDIAPEFPATMKYEKVSFQRRDMAGKCPGCDGGCSECAPDTVPFQRTFAKHGYLSLESGLGGQPADEQAAMTLYPGDRVTLRVRRGDAYYKAQDVWKPANFEIKPSAGSPHTTTSVTFGPMIVSDKDISVSDFEFSGNWDAQANPVRTQPIRCMGVRNHEPCVEAATRFVPEWLNDGYGNRMECLRTGYCEQCAPPGALPIITKQIKLPESCPVTDPHGKHIGTATNFKLVCFMMTSSVVCDIAFDKGADLSNLVNTLIMKTDDIDLPCAFAIRTLALMDRRRHHVSVEVGPVQSVGPTDEACMPDCEQCKAADVTHDSGAPSSATGLLEYAKGRMEQMRAELEKKFGNKPSDVVSDPYDPTKARGGMF